MWFKLNPYLDERPFFHIFRINGANAVLVPGMSRNPQWLIEVFQGWQNYLVSAPLVECAAASPKKV